MDYLGGGGYEKLVIRQSVIDQVEDGHNDFIESELVYENGQLQMNDWVTTDTLAFETRFSANSNRFSQRTREAITHDFEGHVDYTFVDNYQDDPNTTGETTETTKASRATSHEISRSVVVSGWLGRDPDRRTVTNRTEQLARTKIITTTDTDVAIQMGGGTYETDFENRNVDYTKSRNTTVRSLETDFRSNKIWIGKDSSTQSEHERTVDDSKVKHTDPNGSESTDFEYERNTRDYRNTIKGNGQPRGSETLSEVQRSSLPFLIGEDTNGDGVHDQFTEHTNWSDRETTTWPEGGVSEGSGSSQAEVGSYDPSTSPDVPIEIDPVPVSTGNGPSGDGTATSDEPFSLWEFFQIDLNGKNLKAYLGGFYDGFVNEGAVGTVEGIAAVGEALGAYLYFVGSYWAHLGSDTYGVSGTSAGDAIDSATNLAIEYGPVVGQIAKDLPLILSNRREYVSETTRQILEQVDRLLPQILDALKDELAGMSDEQKASMVGKLQGVLTFELALAAGTAGVGTAASAAAKTGKLARLTDKLSGIFSAKFIRRLNDILDNAPKRTMAGASNNLPGSGLIDDGLPIRNLGVDRIKVTNQGIDVVENHLTRFGSHPHNQAMLSRLRRIAKGEIKATPEDLNFYAHELREFVRMRNHGVGPEDFLKLVDDDLAAAQRLYQSTHNAALKEYGIKVGEEALRLYHEFARQFIGRPW